MLRETTKDRLKELRRWARSNRASGVGVRNADGLTIGSIDEDGVFSAYPTLPAVELRKRCSWTITPRASGIDLSQNRAWWRGCIKRCRSIRAIKEA